MVLMGEAGPCAHHSRTSSLPASFWEPPIAVGGGPLSVWLSNSSLTFSSLEALPSSYAAVSAHRSQPEEGWHVWRAASARICASV